VKNFIKSNWIFILALTFHGISLSGSAVMLHDTLPNQIWFVLYHAFMAFAIFKIGFHKGEVKGILKCREIIYSSV
jgi:hypothetical protein